MGRPIQRKSLLAQTVIGSSNPVKATQPSPFQLTNPFPIGDMVYQDLSLRMRGALLTTTGGGTVNVDGILAFLRLIELSTPQHGKVYENLDGIMLHDMNTVWNHGAPIKVDPANTGAGNNPNYEMELILPFKDLKSFNMEDLGLDVLRSGTPLLQINPGVYSDVVAGGAAGDGVNTLTLTPLLQLDPGPINPAIEAPEQFMPYVQGIRVPISSTVVQYQYLLAFGDRIIKRLFLTQRSNVAPFGRLANTVVGVNDTDKLSLKINSQFNWFDSVEWLHLQDKNARDYQLNAMPAGVAVLDFVQHVLGGTSAKGMGGEAGAKLSDALSTLAQNQGTLELDIDVTSVTNGAIWIGYDAVKFIPQGARRPAPTPKTA